MTKTGRRASAALLLAASFTLPAPAEETPQTNITRVEMMPGVPSPLVIPDWKAKAVGYDSYVFDETLAGDYLPLVWEDNARLNFPIDGFGMPSYVGHSTMTGGGAHEAITTIPSVLGATLVGIDKSDQDGVDWVLPLQNYYNSANGQNLVLNYTSTVTGGSFWYTLMPHIVFYQIADRYPGFGQSNQIVYNTANRWYAATGVMGGYQGAADFNYTGFDFATSTPVFNDVWREPDAAAGVAYLLYSAHHRFGQQNFLTGAQWALDYLEQRETNPLYELLVPFGAYTAARMNAEVGTSYDVARLLEWSFSETSTPRPGWGVLVGDFNGYEVNGLVGSNTHGGGYGFAMNTFVYAAPLVPLVRYDERFARAIGRWMLNAAANARYFYKHHIPAANQSSTFWTGDPEGYIPYEGLIKDFEGTSPRAMGDGILHGWAATDFVPYGGAYVGYFGSIISRTNVDEILQLDCLATEFHRAPAYPTYLYYNPLGESRMVDLDVGSEPTAVYDAVANEFLTSGTTGTTSIEMAADSARLIVLVPAESELSHEDGKLFADGVVVDYNAPAPSGVQRWHLY